MNLKALNSLTKYPSIPTYHPLGERGRLQPEPILLPDGPLYATEKIDGTNARIIIVDGDFFIGSRENLLYAKGDRIGDPAMGIVDGLILTATESAIRAGRMPTVIYGEFFGGRTTSCRIYGENTSFRVFDIARFDRAQWDHLLARDPREISTWRDAGGQPFLDVNSMECAADFFGLPIVPVLTVGPPPVSIIGTKAWLEPLAARSELGTGPAEGVVIRSADRKFIAKIRTEDYQRATKGA